jgi:hypothetical protein
MPTEKERMQTRQSSGIDGPSMPEDKPRSQNLTNEKTEPAYDQRILHQYGKAPEPAKIKLIKGQKSSYGWEISYSGSDFTEIIQKIKEADDNLKLIYGAMEA